MSELLEGKKRVRSIYWPVALIEEVERRGAKLDRSFNWLVRQATLVWLERSTEDTAGESPADILASFGDALSALVGDQGSGGEMNEERKQ